MSNTEYPRKEAISQGLKTYIGRDCAFHHGGKRYSANKRCVECYKELSKKYRMTPEGRAYHSQYYKKWYAIDGKRYQAEYFRKWRAAPNGKIYRAVENKNRNFQKAKRTPSWANSPEQLNAIKSIYKLARELTMKTGVRHEVDHIYPLRGKAVCGLHVIENLQILPGHINRAKRNYLPEDFMNRYSREIEL